MRNYNILMDLFSELTENEGNENIKLPEYVMEEIKNMGDTFG